MLLQYEAIPVAIYDIEDKKLVLLFKSCCAASKYIFDSDRFGSNVNSGIKKRSKCRRNRFNRTFCYRQATAEQVAILDGQDMLCLDQRYEATYLHKLTTAYYSNKYELAAKYSPNASPTLTAYYKSRTKSGKESETDEFLSANQFLNVSDKGTRRKSNSLTL